MTHSTLSLLLLTVPMASYSATAAPDKNVRVVPAVFAAARIELQCAVSVKEPVKLMAPIGSVPAATVAALGTPEGGAAVPVCAPFAIMTSTVPPAPIDAGVLKVKTA